MSRIDDRVAFGKELARLREIAGLSQRAVGDLIEDHGGERNVSGSAVGEWERGASAPSPRTAVALEKIVGADDGQLAGLLGYGPPGIVSVTDQLFAMDERLTRIEDALDQLLRRRR